MNTKTILGLGAVAGAIYLANNKTARTKTKKAIGLSDGRKGKEALVWKKAKDSDLKLGQEVLYRSINGNIDIGTDTNFKKGKIKKIIKEYGIKLYDVGMGQYTADDLILIRKTSKKSTTKGK